MMINHKGTQTLETDRLLLRQYKMCDAGDMYANWVTDTEVTRFWGWEPHKNIEETESILSVWIAEYVKLDVYHWVIVHKELLQAIGYIYLSEFDEVTGSASVHYLLSRNLWNQGFMTEACERVIVYAFREIGLKVLQTRHHENNPASGRVLEKCGFRLTHKENKVYEDCERINGVYHIYQLGDAGLS